MSWDSLMAQNRSRIFDRSTDIKILRCRVVGWDEIKSCWIFVVNTRRIHEATGAGWLERFWQLPDLKRAEIIGQRDELM